MCLYVPDVKPWKEQNETGTKQALKHTLKNTFYKSLFTTLVDTKSLFTTFCSINICSLKRYSHFNVYYAYFIPVSRSQISYIRHAYRIFIRWKSGLFQCRPSLFRSLMLDNYEYFIKYFSCFMNSFHSHFDGFPIKIILLWFHAVLYWKSQYTLHSFRSHKTPVLVMARDAISQNGTLFP